MWRRRTLGLLVVGVAALAAGAAVFADSARPAPACRQASFEGDGFVVCRYAPQTHELRLAWRGQAGPLGSLAAMKDALGRDAGRVAFAMNAGMYDDARRPIGLFVDASRTVEPLNRRAGSGNFYMQPNGVFWIDAEGAPHVTETSAYAARAPDARWATQSGPLVVSDGALHPRIEPDGASRYVRNGVGVRDGEALFVISDRPVSFGRFARFLRDELDCPDALYFDGSVSSLWAPELGRLDAGPRLGPMVVVLRR